jgi:hypothetical protein
VTTRLLETTQSLRPYIGLDAEDWHGDATVRSVLFRQSYWNAIHAFGIERPRFTMQLIGAVGTWIVLLALAIWAAVRGSMPIVH